VIHQWHWDSKRALFPIPLDPKNPDARDPRTDLPIQAVNDPNVIRHVRFMQSTFATAMGSDAAGPGYYTAEDPVSSADFGSLLQPTPAGHKPDWLLFQTKLRPGVRFFDGAKDTGFTKPLQDLVTAVGCQDPGFFFPGQTTPPQPSAVTNLQNVFAEASVPVFTFPGAPPPKPTDLPIMQAITQAHAHCKDLRDLTVGLARVSAMKYRFISARLAPCTANPSFAIVSYGDDAIDLQDLVAFDVNTPDQDDGHQQNRLLIQDLWERANKPIGPWPQFWGLTAGFDVSRFLMTNVMGCVPTTSGGFPEDDEPAPPPK
jgi:hypothetical protein